MIIIKGNEIIFGKDDYQKYEKESNNFFTFEDGDFKVILKKDEMEKVIDEIKFSAMGYMAFFLAHEIKNPFFALKAIITQEQIKEKEKILFLIEKIESIISNILIYIKGNAIKRKENIEAILEDTIKEMSFLEIEIEREYLSEKIFVEVDRFIAKRAIANIISNSYESGAKKIKIKTYDEGEYISCEIEDNGEGMDEETLKKIFIPFFTTKERGIGLGMSVVKKFIDTHNGKIQITSQKGKGTKIKISIPS